MNDYTGDADLAIGKMQEKEPPGSGWAPDAVQQERDEAQPARAALHKGAWTLHAGGSSERGGRYANEDWFALGDGIVCLSDGIGGAPYGDVMARICCGALLDAWNALPPSDAGGPQGAERMRAAFLQADALASTVGAYLDAGSGATLVAAAVDGDQLVFGAVGDSAAFLFQEGELERTLSGDGRRDGGGNALEAALGYGALARRPAVVRVACFPARAGARVLLCSDGVWTQLDPGLLSALLGDTGDGSIEGEGPSDAAAFDPHGCAYRIARRAAETGGASSDNATAVVASVVVGPAERPEPVVSAAPWTCEGTSTMAI